METNTVDANNLKQLFINAGIVSMIHMDFKDTKRFLIGKFSENSLCQDKLYNLYLLNKYSEIIIPKIKEQIEKNNATEEEKKILYGFLLERNEVWKI